MTTNHHILETALRQFKTYGVSAVSMDDMAKTLGMAKSTFYHHFSSKNELVFAVMQHLTQKWDTIISELTSLPINPIQKIIKLEYQGIREIQQMSPVFLFDLKKRFHNSFNLYNDYKNHFVYEVIYQLLNDAKTQGMLLEHIDIHAVCELHFFQIERIIQEQKNDSVPFSANIILANFILPGLRGIVKKEFVSEVYSPQ